MICDEQDYASLCRETHDEFYFHVCNKESWDTIKDKEEGELHPLIELVCNECILTTAHCHGHLYNRCYGVVDVFVLGYISFTFFPLCCYAIMRIRIQGEGNSTAWDAVDNRKIILCQALPMLARCSSPRVLSFIRPRLTNPASLPHMHLSPRPCGLAWRRGTAHNERGPFVMALLLVVVLATYALKLLVDVIMIDNSRGGALLACSVATCMVTTRRRVCDTSSASSERRRHVCAPFLKPSAKTGTGRIPISSDPPAPIAHTRYADWQFVLWARQMLMMIVDLLIDADVLLQAGMLLLELFVFLCLQLKFQPYASPEQNRLEASLLAANMLIVGLSMAFYAVRQVAGAVDRRDHAAAAGGGAAVLRGAHGLYGTYAMLRQLEPSALPSWAGRSCRDGARASENCVCARVQGQQVRARAG